MRKYYDQWTAMISGWMELLPIPAICDSALLRVLLLTLSLLCADVEGIL